MAEAKYGRQTPTQSVVLPYSSTFGREAIDLYEKTGRTAQEWQQLQLFDILAVGDDGLFVHTKYGYSVPRRNGKNEIVAIRELYGLLERGERILHTSHRTTTSHAAWERLCRFLDDLGYKEIARESKQKRPPKKAYKATKQFGLETIEIYGQKGRVSFRTRSSKGGLGEGFDLLVIDEAQEYTDDQESALKYVVSDSQNPQTMFCGTPPTAVSSGAVFQRMRAAALAGETVNTGWAEWSIPELTEDIKNRDFWYETNPSLGTILSERKIVDEITSDTVDFNIQRLGVWIAYSQKSEISEAQWNELRESILPELRGRLFVGVKYSHRGDSVAMSIAVKTADGRIMVETIDCQSVQTGNGWIIRFIKQAETERIVIDGQSGQELLAADLKDAGYKRPVVFPKVKELITASAAFRQAIDLRTVCHMGQPSLTQSVTNCERRAIGSGGGYGFQSLKEQIDVALMESAVLAHWACQTAKERRKQKVSY